MTTAPDYLGHVTGWRAWTLDASGGEARLASVVHGGTWPVGEPLVAECRRAPTWHPAPSRHCECGIYAARAVHDAAYHVELPSRRDQIMPIGLVAAWGDVVEGELGWRASRATAQHLYLPLRKPSDLARLQDVVWDLTAYGVPVEILDCTSRSVVGALAAVTQLATLRVVGRPGDTPGPRDVRGVPHVPLRFDPGWNRAA